MIELRGKPVADAVSERVSRKVLRLKELGVSPALAIVRVGNRPDDLAYQRGATSRCEKAGIRVLPYEFDGDIVQERFLSEFSSIAGDKSIHGILLLHPLPRQIDIEEVKKIFPPEKDIDCMLDENSGRIFTGGDVMPPCTAQAVMELLKFYGVKLCGKHAVICGRSMVVGKPLSQLMLRENATVTVCHSRSENMSGITRGADIVVTAVGRAKMFGKEYFSPGQTVIDVGINTDDEGSLCGDVDFAAVSGIAEMITPVPGGVGSVTTAVLAENCVIAAERAAGKEK